MLFFFLREKARRYFLYLLGSRSAAIAALGHRRRENGVCADCGTGGVRVETQLVEGCGLWPFQLIQLIDLRYLCVGTEREERMDVCFLLTLYI